MHHSQQGNNKNRDERLIIPGYIVRKKRIHPIQVQSRQGDCKQVPLSSLDAHTCQKEQWPEVRQTDADTAD